jgi:YebC/PmpR family DNA-binding regulatory protein
MSGHSKWSTIKRKKAATDAARGRMFTKYIREITIAARAGGGDAEVNPRLRTAILAAKSVNMPATNIDRAVQRGTGAIEGAHYEEIHFEGYAPGGVAVLVECATDNRNRAVGDVRHTFTRFGGSLAEAGAVSYLFRPCGVLAVERSAVPEDTLIGAALEAGADDVTVAGDTYEVLTSPGAFEPVKAALVAAGIPVVSAELTKLASLQVPLDEKGAGSVLRLVEALEELDDVQRVFANFDVADDVLAKLAH